jgi:hypothetical protein
VPDEVVGGGGDFLPAGGFGGFGFEFGDGFDGVAGGQDLRAGTAEFLGEGLRAGEGAVGFFVEAGAQGEEGVGEEGVVLGVGLVVTRGLKTV